MHVMQFNAFHNQLAPSGHHVVVVGLIHAHHYCAHALHSGRDDGIDALPMCLAVQHFKQVWVLAYPLHELDQKVVELQLKCGAVAAMGPSRRATGAGPVPYGARAGHGEHSGK